jgi:ABC-2 type transport system ATP-binding protein
MSSTGQAIEASRLVKQYKDVTALDGFDLEVASGSVHGLLGPNGAGKTTAVRVLTTLIRPDGGTARVAGYDVMSDPQAVRRRIGLAGQYAAVDEVLTGRQNLILFGKLFHLGASGARRRAVELLEQFQLADAADKAAKSYSGGMRRRLDLAASMILAPHIMFLDEPTTGLDPRGRNEVWAAIRDLVQGGTTVLLTTQYLDEADRLAQRIAVVDHGRIVAEGTAAELKATIGAEVLVLRVADPARTADAAAEVADLATVDEPQIDVAAGEVRLAVAGPGASAEAVRRLDARRLPLAAVQLEQPSLDDVFLTLTARRPAPDSPQEMPELETA